MKLTVTILDKCPRDRLPGGLQFPDWTQSTIGIRHHSPRRVSCLKHTTWLQLTGHTLALV